MAGGCRRRSRGHTECLSPPGEGETTNAVRAALFLRLDARNALGFIHVTELREIARLWGLGLGLAYDVISLRGLFSGLFSVHVCI